MPQLDTLKKQAKQLVRWHRERNYSVGERVRGALRRYSELSDAEILRLKFPLTEAQELIAREHGFETWTELKAAERPEAKARKAGAADVPQLVAASPMVIVSDVSAAATWYRDVLGFAVLGLHGAPPFFAQVERGGARLSLRFEKGPVFTDGIREREQLLAAMIQVRGVNALFAEFKAAGVDFFQGVKRQPWGAKDFIVRDPDGNLICFGAAVGED